ncbi:MAG: hypothetical protein HYW49_06440 [Deltaproteobacteria bacterium]|nr:hypothetical protein [Deltaproteobacteria bacterium]
MAKWGWGLGFAVWTAAVAAAILTGCSTDQRPTPIGTGTASASSSNATLTSAGLYAGYQSALAAKVIFNKANFHTNYAPGTLGCAGDAKNFFDPLTDRQVPAKPDFIKNIAVDVTNSNALAGASNAAACGLSGSGSSPAANCATFDDLQPLTGEQSRSILIGGYGCAAATGSCSPTSALADVWHLGVPDVATASVWGQQATSIPTLGAGGTAIGLAWAAGDYDQLHDEFYIFGGADPSGTSASGNLEFLSGVVRMTFNADGSVSTVAERTSSNGGVSTLVGYGGWSASNTYFTSQPSPPSALIGSTFTYGVRRDPTSKAWCKAGDTNCPGSSTALSAKALNEHQDYFLLVGGRVGGSNSFSSTIHLYHPHAFSNDVGTSAANGSSSGWTLLSTDTAVNTGTKIMGIADISTASSTTAPFSVNSSYTGWAGRAFHKTVYDPTMNRFYVFGGLKGSPATSGATSATSELWIYDPPALGRRPTSACFTNTAPEANSTLPKTANLAACATPADAGLFCAQTGLGVNQSYFASKYVFPPGGCLQRINSGATTPDARFEHSMAFDGDQKSVVVFGGCKTAPTTIGDTGGAASAIDPTSNCTSTSALLGDTWLYLAPTTAEYVSKDTSIASTANPYSSTDANRFPNIFGADFWLGHFPIFSGNNPAGAQITAPAVDEAMGAWIQLTHTVKPTARVSASLSYDRAHHKFYLQGGFGCNDSSCSSTGALNDLWEFAPPKLATDCTRDSATCSSQGAWTQLRAADATFTAQPTPRKGALMAHGQPMFSYGDDYYTVLDTSCSGQGPIATTDPSVSRQYVGAIYIDVDRGQFGSGENLLISLRMLPFDGSTRLPSVSDNATPYTTIDDTDTSSSSDTAVIRVQLLSSPLKFAEQIMASMQPRFHEFITGTPILADTFVYATAGTGQATEKQILVPLALDSSINLVKIERVQGSVKFYEMTVSKF